MLRYSILVSLISLFLSIQTSGQGLFEQALSSTDSSNNNHLLLNGFVRSVMYASPGNDLGSVALQSLYSHFALSAAINVGKFGDAYAEIRYRTGLEFDHHISEMDLREAYVRLFFGPVQLKAGKQVFAYGSTSFLNPSDQFSPMNPTFRSPDIADMRIGMWAIDTKFLINPASSLQFVWLPIFTPSILMTETIKYPEYIDIAEGIRPDATLRESGFILKYDLHARLLDFNVSFYNGYRSNPSISQDTAIFDLTTFLPQQIVLLKTPYRINSLGLNLSIPLGRNLIRAETNWMDPQKNQRQGVYIPNSEISYALEIEQSGDNATFIVGYYGKYIIDFKAGDYNTTGITDQITGPESLFASGEVIDPSTLSGFLNQQITGFNRLFNYQQKEMYHSIYAILRLSVFHDLLDFELPGMYNITSTELTIMPSFKFNISDGLSFSLGSYSLFGKENTLYNMIGPVLNAGYGSLELNF